ncbi:MAG: hypothetical protein HZB70_02075 [Candidatus Berkelbacteria bacterium]|nr:MAG: hypothetical protein HZB70_02075 [Candidatus Berkelbacteria bacterium]QQG51892.1 MAG: hypothetical protein HY845_00920 [Candidatus Berkelbacteria bacterium]
MSKKSKRNIKALLAKRAQLEELNRGKTNLVSIPGAPKLARPEAPTPVARELNRPELPEYAPGKGIWRTLIGTAIIAVILVAVVVLDNSRHFLAPFGDTLYNALRLND